MDEKKLNTRQWKLYQYIKEYSQNGEWKNRKDIQDDLIEIYPRTSKNIFNDSGLRLMTKDIQAINTNNIPHKVILCDSSKGIKMATKLEYSNILANEKISILSQLKRHNEKVKKISLNGQRKLKMTPYQKEQVESLIVGLLD